VKHTDAFHASPSHHHSKHIFLLRTSFINVQRSNLYYSLVARLSCVVRLQGKAEESWRSERNHPSHFDIRVCHPQWFLRNHWRITKFSINASCKYSTRSVAFSCCDLRLNGVLHPFPTRLRLGKVGSLTELLDYKLRPMYSVESTCQAYCWPIALFLASCISYFHPSSHSIFALFKVLKEANWVLHRKPSPGASVAAPHQSSLRAFSFYSHLSFPSPCADWRFHFTRSTCCVYVCSVDSSH